jgi:DNA-3-methyladenine glycosylase
VIAVLSQRAPQAAPALIGWRLHAHGVVARITETEAYQGEADLACHAARGRTRRTGVLYGAAGMIYIYRCYGVHWMLNLVCDRADEPAAVLVRAVEVISGEELARSRRGLATARAGGGARDARTLANGPGKVCQVLALDGSDHGLHLGDPRCGIALSPPIGPLPRLSCAARVGVSYAGAYWSRRRWRWWERGFPVAS